MGIEVDLSGLTVSKFTFIQLNIDSSIELVFFLSLQYNILVL